MQFKLHHLAIGTGLALTSLSVHSTAIAQNEAQITVKQSPPVVELDQSQPRVQMNTAEPVVEVRQADPRVEVQQAEPELIVEQGQPRLMVENGQRDQALYSLDVNDFEDRDLYDGNGARLGEIEALLVDPKTGQLAATVEVGSFLGLGEKEILVELGELQLLNDRLVMNTAATKGELRARPDYREEDYLEIEDFSGKLSEVETSDYTRFKDRRQ